MFCLLSLGQDTILLQCALKAIVLQIKHNEEINLTGKTLANMTTSGFKLIFRTVLNSFAKGEFLFFDHHMRETRHPLIQTIIRPWE